MKHFYILFITMVTLVSCKPKATPIPLEKGISYDLATYRKQQIADIVYELEFTIPKAKSEAIPSTLKLNFTVNDLKNDVFLDFNEASSNLKSLKINGKTSQINHQKEHLILDKNAIELGKNAVEILFNAGEKSLNRNEEFLYTLLVPDRASTLFPCFDQPDLKAKYKLNITAPKNWKVLAGSVKESITKHNDSTTHTFAPSDLMSTYLFSFVAGQFFEDMQNYGAFDMRFLYRENDTEKIEQSVSSIFNIHQESLDYLEDYTKAGFPFQKMDFVAIPPFQYGGMEHVGAIQYRQSSLFLDKNATQTQQLRRAKLIAHETSHMWFGDWVTMRWFNDVWLKEVFANFMADKIVNPLYPEVNHNLSFMMSHYPSAYSEDRTKGTNPIRQELDNLKNAGSLYGRIIYNKAPIMMRQLELLLGEKAFQKGIQEYISTFSNSNADWNDLVAILDEQSTKDIKKWSDVWVHSAGRPIFYEDMTTDENGAITKFLLKQKAEDGSDKIWSQSFHIKLILETGVEKIIPIKNIVESFDLTEATKGLKIARISYNINGFGYGVFPIETNSINSYKTITSDVSRGYQYINLYENMLLGKVNPLDVYHVFFDAILVEKNELIANYLSNSIRTIFWDFLTPEPQQKLQQNINSGLYELLSTDLPSNLKKTIFQLYQSIAISETGKEHLYNIWKKETTFTNLFLNENDFVALASTLAIYKHKKANEILEEQKGRISNPDRLKRYEWFLPSLSDNTKVRDHFMQSLFDKENREKESWVLVALNNIHHPLRQADAIKHLPKVLEKLEEIQLTGDIFFPKGWLASSIGNYSSKEAYTILQNFLQANPNYQKNLIQKLHQTTDNLVKAQKIKY